MQWRRSLQDLLARVDLAHADGRRPDALPIAESVQPVWVVDDSRAVMVPYQRCVVGATFSRASVAGQYSYVGVRSVTRPIIIRSILVEAAFSYYRLVDYAQWVITVGASVTNITPEWVESSRPESVVPTEPGMRFFSAQSTVAVSPFVGSNPPNIAILGEVNDLALIMPGQAMICTPNTVATATGNSHWRVEMLRPTDSAAPAPIEASTVGP